MSSEEQTNMEEVPNLEDAHDAGSTNGHLCTLILTEGGSAKSFAVCGLTVVGRDQYGVYELHGKLLNTRDASPEQIAENEDINNLIKIIGLQYQMQYTSLDHLKSLRYGKLMILADRNEDGSHMKGLLINFIHTYWPDLLRLPFLEDFITPYVKAMKEKEEQSFFSLSEFEEWKVITSNSHTYDIRYYRGLGTSTLREAKKYFSNMDSHRVLFKYSGTEDDENIIMAFAKNAADQQKEWLTNHMEECRRRKALGLQKKNLYTKETKTVTFSDFVQLELVSYFHFDNVRCIPSAVDGLKPTQRKILYTCIKRNDKCAICVAQLADSVAEQAAYLHGERSLCRSIVHMAQSFVGTNNINLLVPSSGQFGTRLAGGDDSAGRRYIRTMMSPLTRLIFHPHDDPLLTHNYDDTNQKIEPNWYIPIIPMILVNGCEGIGTGWSTKIPNYDPRQLIRCLRKMIAGDEPESLKPYYKNFRGSIEAVGETRFFTNGCVSIIEDVKIEITELPIGTWTTPYKENILEPLLHGTDKIKPVISDYKEYHTDTTVRFVISFAPGEFNKLEREMGGFHRVFKLSGSISINCMHGFDSNNCLRRFERANDILKEFYDLRLEYYAKRKEYLEGMLTAEADKLSDQARFIMEKCNNTLIVENKKRKTMIDELIKRGYRADPVKEWKRKIAMEDDEDADEPVEEDEGESEQSSSKKAPKAPVDPEKAFQKLTDVKKYDYLLGMSMWMLTEERKNELLKQRDAKISELNILKKKSKTDLWLADLEALEKKLNEVEEKERLDELSVNAKTSKAASSKGKAAGGGRKRAEKSTVADLYPSEDGIKVEFKVTEEILKKYEKLSTAVERKKTKKTKVEGGNDEEHDEFDDIVSGTPDKKPGVKKEPKAKAAPKEPKEPKVKKEKNTDGLKQPKLTFTKKKKTNKGSDSEDDDVDADDSLTAALPPREKTTGRRAATKKINYAALLNDDGDDDDDDGDGVVRKIGHDGTAEFSSDEELVDNNITGNSENMFDSLKEEASPEKEKEKPKQKRKLGPKIETTAVKRPKKKNSYSDDSDDDFASSKPKSKKKKKAVSSSEEEMLDTDSDF